MAASSNLADLRAKARQDLDDRKMLISKLIEKRDNAAFKSMLVDNLANAPHINWRSLAKRDPFKYIQCMEKLALMSGYVFDGMQSQTNVLVVDNMSDQALVAALAAARAKTLSLPLIPSSDPSIEVAISVPDSPKQQVCQPPSLVPTSVPNERSTSAGVTGSEAGSGAYATPGVKAKKAGE